MSKAYRHFYWLVFLAIALTASLPWWSRVPFSDSVTFQTIMLIVLALAWLIVAAWWASTNAYISLALTLSLWVDLLHQLVYLVVVAGAIWGAWWVSGFPWLHLAPPARLLFLLALMIGGIGWFIEAFVLFWWPLARDVSGIWIEHYRSRRVYRRRRGF